MKKIILLIVFLLPILLINVYADNYKYVVDDGDLLKNDTEEYIDVYSKYLYDVSKIEYYVITVESLGDYDLDTYSDMAYNNYITSKKRDRGLLILISKNDRQVKVIAGKGISKAVTDDIIDEYIDDYFISFLSTNEWDSGIKNGYTAFYKYLCYHLDIDTSGLDVQNGNDFLFKYRYYIFFVCIWICYIIGYLLPKYFMRLFNKNYKVNNIEKLIFYGSIFVNVVILYYNYNYMNKYLYILLIVELFSILSSTVLNNKNKVYINNNMKKKHINRKVKYKNIKSKKTKMKK